MKTRSDFVSNSSSSSFVVLADENTPEIFKQTLLPFSQFRDQFFKRDIVDCLDYDLYFLNRAANVGEILNKIRFMTPNEFASEYAMLDSGCREFSKFYPVLESDRELVDRLGDLAVENDKLDRIRVEIYRHGKIDWDMQAKAQISATYKLTDKCRNEIEKILDKITGHFLSAIEDRMSDWKFWYAELDDCCESDGRAAMNKYVRWGRIFSNH